MLRNVNGAFSYIFSRTKSTIHSSFFVHKIIFIPPFDTLCTQILATYKLLALYLPHLMPTCLDHTENSFIFIADGWCYKLCWTILDPPPLTPSAFHVFIFSRFFHYPSTLVGLHCRLTPRLLLLSMVSCLLS